MTRRRSRLGHLLLVGLAVLPLLRLGHGALHGGLGANPIETLTHVTGAWTLRLLLASLAVSPLRRLLRWPALAPYRRTLGLLAFTYACLHFATYLGLDLALDFGALAEDVAERPYLTVGFSGFLLLVPLALTSGRWAVRRLGWRWVQLHRLVYLAGVCGVVHFLWLVKADLREPLIHAGILGGLLVERGVRLAWRTLPARASRPSAG